MPSGSSPKRERQYKHIESSAKKRGASTGRAQEIAARTVNKQRAESGEAKSSGANSKNSSASSKNSSAKSRSSASSAGRGGGSRSSSGSSSNTTFRELYAEAQRRDIKGRSSMDKAQLERALAGSGGKRGK